MRSATRRSARLAGALLAGFVLAGLLLAGCTVPVREIGNSTGTTSASPAGISSAPAELGAPPAVTVSDLGGGAEPADGTEPAESTASDPAPGSTVTVTRTRSTAPSGVTRPTSTPADPAASRQTSGTPHTAGETTRTGPAATTTALTVSNCPGCVVLATHVDVAPGLNAALVTARGRALLVAVRSGGAVAAAANITYGATFPRPADGVLPCADGRCLVQGVQSDGRAVISAWTLSESGSWTDVSIPNGFVSANPNARIVDLVGSQGIAVQEQQGPSAIWTVYGWDDGEYAVIGCVPVGQPIAVDSLDQDACLS